MNIDVKTDGLTIDNWRWAHPSVLGLHGGLVSVQFSDLHFDVRFGVVRHPDSFCPWDQEVRRGSLLQHKNTHTHCVRAAPLLWRGLSFLPTKSMNLRQTSVIICEFLKTLLSVACDGDTEWPGSPMPQHNVGSEVNGCVPSNAWALAARCSRLVRRR